MEIRLAFPNEVDTIMQVIEGAKKCLAEAGSTQWQNGYPDADTIIEDIISGQAYVALEEGELLAYAAVTKSPEKAYEAIYDGNWEGRESEYLVFHRIAVASDVQGQGVAQTFLEGLIEGFDYLDFRSDTHAKNKAMQHIFEILGFKQVGKVPVDGERLAYQKIKSNA
ncbi:GNAT family N-acetyltransferase [Streptococcus infantis]|uniref:GNAT family N-acetyltransferase n=1 Tax=Streptococcus infantis TaxID=68892 RepID=UPI0020C880ED|nr:GNAT family N-acetyltransferase [Streptococcus infantis]MCP9057102.1 GNAT family N-acetyltransferase [Streptococcus infantis]MCP9081398.1 GNAT family N-acetyltransferase [Streptococcus infantis]